MSQVTPPKTRSFIALLLIAVAVAVVSMSFALMVRKESAPRGGLGARARAGRRGTHRPQGAAEPTRRIRVLRQRRESARARGCAGTGRTGLGAAVALTAATHGIIVVIWPGMVMLITPA